MLVSHPGLPPKPMRAGGHYHYAIMLLAAVNKGGVQLQLRSRRPARPALHKLVEFPARGRIRGR